MPADIDTTQPIAPRPAYQLAGQYATPSEVLTALHNRLVLHSQLRDRVKEYLGDPEKRQTPDIGTHLVTLSVPAIRPERGPGQGSVGWPVTVVARITVYTRFDGPAADHREWFRRHWPLVAWCWNAVVGKMLYDRYDVSDPDQTTGTQAFFPTGRPLTTGLMTPSENQTVKTNVLVGYGYTEFHVDVKTVMPLDRHLVV